MLLIQHATIIRQYQQTLMLRQNDAHAGRRAHVVTCTRGDVHTRRRANGKEPGCLNN